MARSPLADEYEAAVFRTIVNSWVSGREVGPSKKTEEAGEGRGGRRRPVKMNPEGYHFDCYDAVQEGRYEDRGKKIIIRDGHRFLASQLIKTDSTQLCLVEVALEEPPGKGRFCSLKGLLEDTERGMREAQGHLGGASLAQMQEVVDRLGVFQGGGVPFTVKLDDPLGNVQFEGEGKEGVEVEWYERSRMDLGEYGLPMEPPLGGGEGVARITELLKTCRRVVGLTGAGVSTESGIAAWRGVENSSCKTNVWEEFDVQDAVLSAFRSDPVRQVRNWRRQAVMQSEFMKAVPNAAHHFFVELHRRGQLAGLLTQNIDGLHQRAGLPEEYLVELHGSAFRAKGDTCNHPQRPVEELVEWAEANKSCPRCAECGGLVRVATVLFEEPLCSDTLKCATDLLASCDLLIVMGSSLLVAPAKTFPESCLTRHVPVVLLNQGGTHLDGVVDVCIDDQPCGEVCSSVLDALSRVKPL